MKIARPKWSWVSHNTPAEVLLTSSVMLTHSPKHSSKCNNAKNKIKHRQPMLFFGYDLCTFFFLLLAFDSCQLFVSVLVHVKGSPLKGIKAKCESATVCEHLDCTWYLCTWLFYLSCQIENSSMSSIRWFSIISSVQFTLFGLIICTIRVAIIAIGKAAEWHGIHEVGLLCEFQFLRFCAKK